MMTMGDLRAEVHVWQRLPSFMQRCVTDGAEVTNEIDKPLTSVIRHQDQCVWLIWLSDDDYHDLGRHFGMMCADELERKRTIAAAHGWDFHPIQLRRWRAVHRQVASSHDAYHGRENLWEVAGSAASRGMSFESASSQSMAVRGRHLFEEATSSEEEG
jgi:hypothetical protein